MGAGNVIIKASLKSASVARIALASVVVAHGMEKNVFVGRIMMSSLPIKIERGQSEWFKGLKILFGMGGKVTQKRKVYTKNAIVKQKGIALDEGDYLILN